MRQQFSSFEEMAEHLNDPAIAAPPVNFWRYQKGDLQANGDKGAAVVDRSVMANLVERGFLEQHHCIAAETLLELRHAFLNRLSYKLNGLMILGMESLSLSANDTADLFDEIVHAITQRRVRIIDHACHAPADKEPGIDGSAVPNAYRECFELLFKTIWLITERRREEKKCN